MPVVLACVPYNVCVCLNISKFRGIKLVFGALSETNVWLLAFRPILVLEIISYR